MTEETKKATSRISIEAAKYGITAKEFTDAVFSKRNTLSKEDVDHVMNVANKLAVCEEEQIIVGDVSALMEGIK